MSLYRYRRVIALAGFIGVAAIGIGAVEQEPPKVVEHVYTVEPGDTLWEISEKYRDSNEDIRELIYAIKKDNGIENGQLSPGQKIIIKKELPHTAIEGNSAK